jgi:serine/threonine-protein kinase RsbW
MKTEISFASKMENVNIIEKIVDELSAQYNFGTEIYGNILVSSVEAVNNAIIHGNKLDESKSVHVKIEIEGDMLSIKVRDEGPGFDYNNIADPTLPENIEKPHGRGLFLIRHLADETHFYNEGKELELKFKIN